MTERGTTGAGEPQTTGVRRVQQPLKLDGYGTSGSDIRLGQIRICHNGSRPLTSPAMIHGSMVMDGFDGADFRQYERRVRLFVSNT